MASDQEKSKAQLTAELQETREHNSQLQANLQDYRQSLEKIQDSRTLVQGVLDGLPLNIAVLDEKGEIILVNQAWRKFAQKNGASVQTVSEGVNYLQLCDRASGKWAEEAKPFARGIRDVLSGELQEYTLEYPCHSRNTQRWFIGRVTPFPYQGSHKAIVLHEDITKRRHAEEELKLNEQKFRQIFNSSNDALFIHDLDGNFWEVNDTACRILGYSREEFLRMSVMDIDSPKSASLAPEKIRQVEKKGQMMFETTHLRKDGTEVRVELNSSRMQYNHRVCILSVGRDITQRKQFEQALQQKSQALKERVKELDCLYGLSKLIEQPGITRDELMHSTTELIPPAYQYPELTCVRILLENNTYTTCGFRETKWWQSADIVVDQNQVGRIEVFYIQEMTDLNENPFLKEEQDLLENLAEKLAHYLERQKVEEELQKSEQKTKVALKEVQELINSISSLLISLDHNWQIYRWNNAAEEILGISKEETQGVYLKQCPVSWEWEKIESGLWESKLNLKQVRVEDVSYLTADNVNGFLAITIHPIIEGAEELFSGFLILGTDITEKKLMESQFLQDQKMDAIGQLAAGIAHEINTPIQYVDGNTNYLKDVFQDILDLFNSYSELLELAEQEQVATSLSAEIKQKQDNLDIDFLQEDIPDSLDESLEGLQKVAKIVRSMKDFSHPGESDKVQVDINKALEDTITICKNEWKYSSNVYTDYDLDLPLVPCFKDEINQVFLNLIVNSAQSIAESGSSDGKEQGSINVSTCKNSEYAEIKISDTGPGIPEHIRDRIFNPFFTTKEVGKGSGQGLYIAYNIITEKHQGIMNFESEDGKGTTFFIKLPVND